MKINSRLKTIGDLVPLSSYPLDIGCDHALLSIYLVKEKGMKKALASDNKSGPLKKAKENVPIDGTTGKELVPEEEKNEMDAVMQTNKMMSWFMPLMSVSVAMIAPLGLALYWLTNNILMIMERLILNKVIKTEEEEQDG